MLYDIIKKDGDLPYGIFQERKGDGLKKIYSVLLVVLILVCPLLQSCTDAVKGLDGFVNSPYAASDAFGRLDPWRILDGKEGVYSVKVNNVFTNADDDFKEKYFPAEISALGAYSPSDSALMLEFEGQFFDISETFGISLGPDGGLMLNGGAYSYRPEKLFEDLRGIYTRLLEKLEENTSQEDYATYPSSLDDGTGDTDCTEIRLTLKGDRARDALDAVFSSIGRDENAVSCLTEAINLKRLLCGKNGVTRAYAEELLAQRGDVDWVRIIKDGKIISERISLAGYEMSSRYLLTPSGAEYTLLFKKDGSELLGITYVYNSGTKDAAKLLITMPDEEYNTVLMYESNSRHVMKSGSVMTDITLRRGSETVIGLYYSMTYKENAGVYTLDAEGYIKRMNESVKFTSDAEITRSEGDIFPVPEGYTDKGEIKNAAEMLEKIKNDAPVLWGFIRGE